MMQFKKWFLNEIKQDLASTMFGVKNRNLNTIFGNKDRIVIPFIIDASAKYLIEYFKNNKITYDPEAGVVSLTSPQGKVSKLKLMKFLEKAELPEPVLAWAKKQPEIHKSLKTAMDVMKGTKFDIDDLAIVLTRHPIDVVRMADFECLPNQQGGQSCHAPTGSHFDNAIDEAQKEGGAVAYVVKKSDVNKINVNTPEIFNDPDRKINGILPISRIRIRRFTNKEGDIGIPEMKVYGLSIPGFYYSLKTFLRNKQNIQDALDSKDYKLQGGSYIDTSASKLFSTFFDDEADYVEEEGGYDEVGDEEDSNEEDSRIQRAAEQIVLHNSYEMKPLEIKYSILYDEDVEFYVVYKQLLVIKKEYCLQELEAGKKYEYSKEVIKDIGDHVYGYAKELEIELRIGSYEKLSYRPEENYYKLSDDGENVIFGFNINFFPDTSIYHQDINGMENFVDSLVRPHFPKAIDSLVRNSLEDAKIVAEHPVAQYLNMSADDLQNLDDNKYRLTYNHHHPDEKETTVDHYTSIYAHHFAVSPLSIELLPINNNDDYNDAMSELVKALYNKRQHPEISRKGLMPEFIFMNERWTHDFLRHLNEIIKTSSVMPKFENPLNTIHFLQYDYSYYGPSKSYSGQIKPEPLKFKFKVMLNRDQDPKLVSYVIRLFDYYDDHHEQLDDLIAKKFRDLLRPVAGAVLKKYL
jgi:hypothetical protein